MSGMGKLWAGRVYGTNTGNIFIDLKEDEEDISGILRFNDISYGIMIYEISGTYTDGTLKIHGKHINPSPGIGEIVLNAEAILTAQGSLKGKWETSIGTAGTFEVFPHEHNNQENISRSPEQIFSKPIELGSLRLFNEDIRQLFAHIKQDFTTARLIVTHRINGNEKIQYEEDFLRDYDATNNFNTQYLKLNIQEPDANGVNRSVVIQIGVQGSNDIRVQGTQESWVRGKAENLASFLRHFESNTLTTFKKFGLGLNQLIFFAMLVCMPSIKSLHMRAIFGSSIFLIMLSFWWFHTHFIPIALISKLQRPQNVWNRYGPGVGSWLAGIVGTIIATLIFEWIIKYHQ